MKAASTDPQTRQLMVERLEKWISERRRHSPTLADWEQDTAFLAVVAVEYPLDMELSRMDNYKAQSARSRLRLRHEGYKLLRDARQKIQALNDAASIALASLTGDEEE